MFCPGCRWITCPKFPKLKVVKVRQSIPGKLKLLSFRVETEKNCLPSQHFAFLQRSFKLSASGFAYLLSNRFKFKFWDLLSIIGDHCFEKLNSKIDIK